MVNMKILDWDLAIARYQPRPCGQQGGFAPTYFLEKYLVWQHFFWKYFWWFFFWKIFLVNIFFLKIFLATVFCSKNFLRKYFFEKYFWENIFLKNIFGKNIFDENIFGNNIFFGKGFDFPSLLSTPNIQLPPPLTSYLKLRGGGTNEEGRTYGPDGAHNDCSFYCIR